MAEVEKRRFFGGFLRVPKPEDKEDEQKLQEYRRLCNLESKHLRAYLRGDKRFSFEKDIRGFPIFYNVIEIWK